MSPSPLAIAFSLLLLSIWLFTLLRRKPGRKLPPGPPGLPVIGHLHMLGRLPHRTLHKMSQKHGPIMSIRLGLVPTIVVSSPRAAELFLKTHDANFASRPQIEASEQLSYGSKGVAFAKYGQYWRSMRKLCVSELLSVHKVEGLQGMRREEVGLLVRRLKEKARGVVDLSEEVARVVEDMTCRMVFGRISDERFDLKGVVKEALELMGAFNPGDYLPFLAPFDILGLTRHLKAISKTLDEILEKIINEHEQDADRNQSQHKDFIHTMLSLKNKPTTTLDSFSYVIGRKNIKAIVLDMIGGSLDTSATAIEWIMSELLRHPKVMQKLQEELKKFVSEDNMVEEADLAKLKYLEMVIKESLRLHPVAPLLIPHACIEDIVIDDYFIPKNSRILINGWTIGRDTEVWTTNAEEFVLERFIGSDIDLRGKHFELIPFGSSRRGCPGINLGLMNIRLVVAQLVHCFDWELPNGMSQNELDMSEKFGLSMPRAKHLLAIPSYRLLD